MNETTVRNRAVVANISLSLDGRTGRPGGEYDMGWIVPHASTNASRDHMIKVTGPATTVLLGRKNYGGIREFWPSVADNEETDARDQAFSKWLNFVEKIVFSSTLKEASWEKSRVVNDDPVTVVNDLKQKGDGDIIVLASSSIIKRLLEADALDRLSITLCPEVAGGGARLFDEGISSSSWKLRESTVTESGAICLIYDRVRDGK